MTDRGSGTVHVVLVALLLLAHFTFRPLLRDLPVAPDLLVGGLLLATLRLSAGHAALLGFTLGLLDSAIGMEGVGALSIVYSLLGFLAARSRDLLYADAARFPYTYIFIGTWVAQVGTALALQVVPGVSFLLVAVGTAILTAVVCGLVAATLDRVWAE
ncbi:MAG: hypothetical protein ABFS14_08810 [Gemmatimonadota bacterium]